METVWRMIMGGNAPPAVEVVNDSDDDDVRDVSPAASSKPRGPTLATKLVSFSDGKLDVVNMPHLSDASRPLRVLIILGKARQGKSTFLNCVTAHLLKATATAAAAAAAGAPPPRKRGKGAASTSSAPAAGPGFQPPFHTSDSDEHCTMGIDAYLVSSEASGRAEDVLLLDCQGLAMDDSSHDPALLLAAYLLGDVLIFNDQGILKNDALKLLEPTAAFATRISGDNNSTKPCLVFRMTDAGMVKDPQAIVKRLLDVRHADHYQSIRDSLKALFTQTLGVRTTELDRAELRALTTGDGVAGMLALLQAGHESGFLEAVERVLATGAPRRTAGQWAAAVPLAVAQINSGTKISLERLDVVRLVGKDDMNDFIKNLDSNKYFTDLQVDGSQATFEANVWPRMRDAEALLADFEKRFKLLSRELREEQAKWLRNKLAEPVQRAHLAAKAAASQALQAHVAAAQADRRVLALLSHTPAASIAQQAQSARDALKAHLAPLRAALVGVYAPVAQPLATWAAEQEEVLRVALEAYAQEEAAVAKAAEREAAAMGKGCPANLVAAVRAAPPSCEDELLRDRAAVLTDAVARLAMAPGGAVWKAGAATAWVCVRLEGGNVRVLQGVLRRKRARGDLRAWRPSPKSSFEGTWEAVEDGAADEPGGGGPAADVEAQLSARGFDLGAPGKHFHPLLYDAVMGGGLAHTHALLGPLARVVGGTLLPAATGAGGETAASRAVAAALDAAVEDALRGLFSLKPAGAPMSEDGLLLQATRQGRHPGVRLVLVDLRDAHEAARGAPVMLMTEATYAHTWERAFAAAAKDVVDAGACATSEQALSAATRRDELPVANTDRRLPRVQLRYELTSGGATSEERWARRGAGAHTLVPELFISSLKRVLVQDDAAPTAGKGGGGGRIFHGWASVQDAMAERAKARAAAV